MKIKTKRLILREWKMSDIDDIVSGLNEFDVAKNLTSPYPYTRDDAIEFLTKHRKHKPNSYYFAVTTTDGRVIGGTNVSINNEGEYHGGIWICKDVWGLGYGTEIWIARAKFAFDYLGADALINGYYDFNDRSRRMQLKVGGKNFGEKTNFCPALNSEVREVVTVLTKSAFEDYYSKIDFKYKQLK